MPEIAVELRDIRKVFSRVRANDGVSLTVPAGEIHALVGENGAGKSTLMKILYGLYAPDSGEILLHGRPAKFRSPADARKAGLGMVHQHFMLVRPFTVLQNLLLGREGAGALAPLPRETAAREVREASERYGLPVDPAARVEDLPVGVQQRVEILRVLLHGADILIFDEPTAVLTPPEVLEFLAVLKRLRGQGKTILLITHKLDEVMAIADRVTVLRAGRVVGNRSVAATSSGELVELMVGRAVRTGVRAPGHPAGDAVLSVRGLKVLDARRALRLEDLSFEVRAGEILGIAGVEGNGQSELLEALAGLMKVESGEIRLQGRLLENASASARQAAGMAHIPEDRHRRGLVLEMTLEENALLGRQREPAFSGRALLRPAAIHAYAVDLIARYDVRPPDASLRAADLSGGNQQKLVVARELSRTPSLLLAAQPTRGVDIGAIEFIHARLREARDAGQAVLLVSADLGEVMTLADRILVLYRGRIAGEVQGEGATEEQLGRLMLGGAA